MDCVCALHKVLGQMIGIWVWESSLSADLHCESGITCLWGWAVFELLEVQGKGGTQVSSRNGECSVCRWKWEFCQCRSSQGNLARSKQSKYRSHNPSNIKYNALEGEEERRSWVFCLPIEQDCRGLRELQGSNRKDGDMGSQWIAVICRRERHRFWRLRGFVKEQEVKNNFKRNGSLLNDEHLNFLDGSSDNPVLMSCHMENRWFLLSFPHLFEQRTAELTPVAGICAPFIYVKWLDNSKPQVPQEGYEHPSSKQRLMGLSGSSVAALGYHPDFMKSCHGSVYKAEIVSLLWSFTETRNNRVKMYY